MSNGLSLEHPAPADKRAIISHWLRKVKNSPRSQVNYRARNWTQGLIFSLFHPALLGNLLPLVAECKPLPPKFTPLMSASSAQPSEVSNTLFECWFWGPSSMPRYRYFWRKPLRCHDCHICWLVHETKAGELLNLKIWGWTSGVLNSKATQNPKMNRYWVHFFKEEALSLLLSDFKGICDPRKTK